MECSIATSSCDFHCTGANYSHVWAELHGPFLEKIGCERCRDHARELFIFLHDVVNLGLGKHLFDEANFKKVYAQVLCVSKNVPGIEKVLGEHAQHAHEEEVARYTGHADH